MAFWDPLHSSVYCALAQFIQFEININLNYIECNNVLNMVFVCLLEMVTKFRNKKEELWKGKVLANMISGNFERRKTTATMKLVYSNGEKTQLI